MTTIFASKCSKPKLHSFKSICDPKSKTFDRIFSKNVLCSTKFSNSIEPRRNQSAISCFHFQRRTISDWPPILLRVARYTELRVESFTIVLRPHQPAGVGWLFVLLADFNRNRAATMSLPEGHYVRPWPQLRARNSAQPCVVKLSLPQQKLRNNVEYSKFVCPFNGNLVTGFSPFTEKEEKMHPILPQTAAIFWS